MNIHIKNILEPLSEATSSSLQPLYIGANERLVISMNEKGSHFVLDFYRLGWDNKRQFPGNAANLMVRRIPECVQHPSKVPGLFVAGATDFTALVLSAAWPKEQMSFADELAEAQFTFLLKRFTSQTATAIAVANFKANKTLPSTPDDFIVHPSNPLADYQQFGINAWTDKEAFAAFMEQGTGKTPMAVARICWMASRARRGLYGKPHMLRVLVVCPRQVRLNWVNEIERFAVVSGKATVIRGGVINRTHSLLRAVKEDKECEFAVAIASYQTVTNTEAIFALNGENGKPMWDLVILDESHSIKNRNSLRSKMCLKLRSVSMRRMILTGTPIANSPNDLYAQLEFLGEGLSGFISPKEFRNFHGKYEKTKMGIDRLVALKNIPLLQERLSRLAFMLKKEDAGLNLPPKVRIPVEVEMTSKQAKWYNMVSEQLILEIENDQKKDEKDRMTTEHILTKLLRLAQITSGFVKWDEVRNEETGALISPARTEQIDATNPKIEAILKIVKNGAKAFLENEEGEETDPEETTETTTVSVNGISKTIIWATFIEDIRTVCEALKANGIDHVSYYGATSEADREEAVRRFNLDPNCRVFVGNQMTAGAGLNLIGADPTKPEDRSTYCDTMIFMSQNWSMTDRAQAEDRAHRRGARGEQLTIIDLVVPGTIDEEIRLRVTDKMRNAANIQDIREVLSRVLTYNNGED